MTGLEGVWVAYMGVLALLSLNGLHRLWMMAVVLRRPPTPDRPCPEELPQVTVQLPVFNEKHVVERLMRAVVALDWPRDRLHVQLLDDSTDESADVGRRAVEEAAAAGVDAVWIHREDRVGYKAGALEAGLACAKGDLLAIFDADFVPDPDFLRRTVPHLLEEGVGMVQARWGHLNPDHSWLTRVQSVLLDGHFVVEHAARHGSGRWFNFNGTAGVWRRQAIVDGGGWQHDTLTEDMDLSYRSQLAGWRFVYLPEVIAPAELPEDMAAFKAQQHRWAKGSVQCARKLLPRIWASDAPLGHKVEATAHMTANLSYPWVVLLTLMMPWAVSARLQREGSPVLLGLDLLLFTCAVLPFVAFYALAVVRSGQAVPVRLAFLPVVLATGLGMAVAQTRAVLDAWFGPVGTFVRTPKRGDAVAGLYRAAREGLSTPLEVALAGYLSVALAWVVAGGHAASAPFLALFTTGYGLVAWGSLRRT